MSIRMDLTDGASGALPPPEIAPGYLFAGRYRLLEEIQRDDYRLTFIAHQNAPFHRMVLLRTLRPDADSRETRARFALEGLVLSSLDHPQIAAVHDGSGDRDEQSWPYFVLQLVRAGSLAEYATATRFDLRARLDLFLTLCSPVFHIHLKGLILRDIDPARIKVDFRGGRPTAIIEDLSRACAMPSPSMSRLLPPPGRVPGLRTTMSPERAHSDQFLLDVRSDVFALGAILYELLCGVPPFDRDRLESADWDEFQRILREETPPAPSARLLALPDSQAAAIAAARNTTPAALARAVRGDLDRIVMTAMSRNREQRYSWVKALAADIQRHLEGRPVPRPGTSSSLTPQTSWWRKLFRR